VAVPELTGSESIQELCTQPEGDYYGNPADEIEVYVLMPQASEPLPP
jgi:hypothetical protein